jgi:hypothetical protein
VGDWWTRFQDASHEERERMLLAPEQGAGTGRKRRRRRRGKRADGDEATGSSPDEHSADSEP